MSSRTALFWLLASLILVSCLSLMAGAVPLSVQVVINTLLGLEGPRQDFIILRSRLPRTLLALLTGSALALSGAIIQAVLRNALASPKIIGINAGAALGVLALTLLLPGLPQIWLPLAAAVGGATAAALVLLLAGLRRPSPTRLALFGIAVGFLCEALVEFILVTAPSFSMSSPLLWLTGTLWGRGWDEIQLIWRPVLLLMALALACSYRMDLMGLDEAQATGLGANLRRERFFLLALATLLAALAVSVVGVLGFVGLIAPHIARALVGGNHRALLPVAMCIGALLVISADAAGRAIAPPTEISAGILTALFGAPFFIFLLIRNRNEASS